MAELKIRVSKLPQTELEYGLTSNKRTLRIYVNNLLEGKASSSQTRKLKQKESEFPKEESK